METQVKESIRAENIAYSYGDRLAVDHISFHVEEGEILGFLGPNGAGKTTTLKMLVGLLVPQEGNITILGMDVVKERARVWAQTGVCCEEKGLYEEVTAEGNLKFSAAIIPPPGEEASGVNDAGQGLEMLRSESFLNRQPHLPHKRLRGRLEGGRLADHGACRFRPPLPGTAGALRGQAGEGLPRLVLSLGG